MEKSDLRYIPHVALAVAITAGEILVKEILPTTRELGKAAIDSWNAHTEMYKAEESYLKHLENIRSYND